MKSISVLEINNFVGNKFVKSKSERYFEVINPTNNSVIATIPDSTAEDVDYAAKQALKAFKDSWCILKPERRREYLFSIAKEIEKNQEDLAKIETLNTGIPISQTRAQVKRAAENFSFFAEMCTKIIERAFPVGEDFLNYTVRMPVGVAGLITPWNTPLMLETWKIAPCLAAGNTCILKPAEWTPLTANKLAELIMNIGLPDGVFNVVHGIGETTGASVVSNPSIKLISFTGETTTGKEIMRNGSSSLKRFSMELGGKNAAIVFNDCDLDKALDSVIFMAFSLNGERCTSNSRVLVQKEIYSEFVDALSKRIEKIKVGDPLNERTELGPLVRPEHLSRVLGYVEIGKKEGANLTVGGSKIEKFEGNFMEPTLFIDVKKEMRIFQEEIFGPVLVATSFSDENDAIKLSNDVSYGLASYIWTNDVAKAMRVASKLETGMVWINSHNVRDLRTPFGGMKNSGIGREGGDYSFEFYTELKTVHIALRDQKVPRFGLGN